MTGASVGATNSGASSGAAKTLAALKSIRQARPEGAPVYIISDNLSAHKDDRVRAWVARNKIQLCFTPTYASWANPIEAQFGSLRTFVTAGSNHSTLVDGSLERI
jgi:transposase